MSGDGYLSYYVPKDWVLLAAVDESASYEVDVAEIYRDGDKYILATATGCSCWEGDYEAQEFASLDDIEKAVLYREGYVYNPSLAGARELVELARGADR